MSYSPYKMYPDNHYLFAKNLLDGTTEQALIDWFRKADNDATHVHIFRKGRAVVGFSSAEEAAKAFQERDGEILNEHERHMRLSPYTSDRDPRPKNNPTPISSKVPGTYQESGKQTTSRGPGFLDANFPVLPSMATTATAPETLQAEPAAQPEVQVQQQKAEPTYLSGHIIEGTQPPMLNLEDWWNSTWPNAKEHLIGNYTSGASRGEVQSHK